MNGYDVAIIGAGVIGGLIARELSKYEISVCLIEKENSVGDQTTKANSAIVHAGYDVIKGTGKEKFNVSGNQMMEGVCEELDVPFKRIGSLLLAFNDEEIITIEEIYNRGINNGVKDLFIFDGDEARTLEPELSKEVKKALFAKTGGIVCPFTITINGVKNAVDNGVALKLNTEVKSIIKDNGIFRISTNKENIEATYVINCGGVYADKIANMIGDFSFEIKARKGQYLLYDRILGDKVSHVIFQAPSKMGKGVLVSPTVHGNLIVGPSADDIDDKDDLTTSADEILTVLETAKRSVPSLSLKDIITTFSGNRAVSNNNDFIVKQSDIDKNFINVAGIQSPGLTSAPSIAAYIGELIKSLDNNIKLKDNYNGRLSRSKHILEMSKEELNQLIKENPAYGRIICRCETVPEGEIVDKIKNGSTDLDSIKRATRAGSGRCQGGFCGPKILEIISEVTGISYTEITKKGNGSYILVGETRKGE